MAEHETSRRAVLKGSALGAGALFGAAGLASAARAATGTPTPTIGEPVGDHYFLKLDGISGDARQKGFEKWIELTDFSWGASRAADDGTTTVRQAKEVQVHFDAPSSIASPLLMLGTVTGKAIKAGSLYVANAEGRTFIKGEFTQIVISSFQISGDSEETPGDRGTLSFGRIKFTFYGQNPDGTTNPVSMVWDTRSQKV